MPLKVLKELVEQGLDLVITDNHLPVVDTAVLTMAVQQHVVAQYHGDRQLAMRQALARFGEVLPLGDLAEWTADERTALYLWALSLDLIPDLEGWSLRERKQLVALIKAKGAPLETAVQKELRVAARLLDRWATSTAG